MISGKVIKALRYYKNFTQRQMAEKMGISQQAYSKMENKEWINKLKAEKILMILGSTSDEIESIEKALHIK